MRDIKFRFFDGVKMNHNIMGYDFNCGGPDKNVLAAWNDKKECIDYYDISEGLELMQYTGLNDKDGKEIYEGDILEHCRETRWEVVFNKGCFKRASVEHPISNLYLLGESDLENMRIIGNIYETIN